MAHYGEDIEYVEIDVDEVVTETELAVLFRVDPDDTFWIPKSVMSEWPEVGEEGTVSAARWFCEKEGLV